MININQSNLKNLQTSVLSAHVDIHNKQKDIQDTILNVSQVLSNFVDTLQTIQEDLKNVSDDLSEITDDLIDITGGQDEFKGLIDIKNELEDGLDIEDFIERCVILYSPDTSGCNIRFTTYTCTDDYNNYNCFMNYTFGSDTSGYFECKMDYQGSKDENYQGNNLNCDVKYKSGDLDCGMAYSVSSIDGDFGESCVGKFSADGRGCETTYNYTSTEDGNRIVCMEGYNNHGLQCDNGYATIGYQYNCTSNYKDNSGNDCPSGYYYNQFKGKRCKNSYTTTINGTDITCNGYYSQAGATVCEGGFSSSDGGVYCPVDYNETCTAEDGSNKCTSCNSSCHSGNTETCSECVSSCNSENTICSKCHEGGWTAPCYQVCTPTNNSCAVTYANACGTGYIAQCTVCVGSCHSGCDQGFSTSGCSSSNDVNVD